MYGLNDLLLESLRAAVLAALLLYLVVRSRHSRFGTLQGARLIIAGFGLLLLATLLDITDEIPGLERYVIIGATETEAYIETIFGYVAAFITLFIGFVRIIPSIARLEKVDQELRESEEKFRSVFETIPDGLSITRLRDGLVVDANPAIAEVSGLRREQLLGRTSVELGVWVNPADRERMVQGVLANGLVRNMEAQLSDAAGRRHDFLISARLMQLQGEAHTLAAFKDITERKAALRALQESEARYRRLHESMSDAFGLVDMDGNILDVNKAFATMLGYSAEELKQLSYRDITPERWHAEESRILAEQVIPRGSSEIYEKECRRKDGRVVPVELRTYLLADDHGNPVGMWAIVRDISERRMVLKALKESEARFRLVFAASPDPLVIARADGSGIVDVNRAFEAETGITREEALGKTSAELDLWVDPTGREEFMNVLRRDGVVSNLEAKLRSKSGEIRDCLVSAQLVELDGVLCVLLDSRDITRQKQAESVLMDMDRMKSDFISTAAHELRTPLATMLGYTELLISPDTFGGFSAEQRKEFLAEIYQKGETLSRIVDEMLDISRIESGQSIALDRQPHEPRAWLTKVMRRFELQGDRHGFVLDFDGPQPEVLTCDLHRMTQVLENLLSNAVKYSPRGGTIRVSGRVAHDDYVVSVADQGIGMTSEQASRVFDKFYRADSSNTAIGGLGLGMSIARQIVETHGGRIWVESEAGKGTTVSFSLPLT